MDKIFASLDNIQLFFEMLFQDCEDQNTFRPQTCEFNTYEVITLLRKDSTKDLISK